MPFWKDLILGRWNKVVYESSVQINKLRGDGACRNPISDKTLLDKYPLRLNKISSHKEYRDFLESFKDSLAEREEIEKKIITNGYSLLVEGYCYTCARSSLFLIRCKYHPIILSGRKMLNWHEGLVCSRCRLNNRMRGSIHLFEQTLKPRRDARIYLTEQTTRLYIWFSNQYQCVTGSEYLGADLPLGDTNEANVKNEDLGQLTFPDGGFDYILSFSVFEHMPDYIKGLKECCRCLKPGGFLVIHVPFFPDFADNLVRARVNSQGGVEHLHPPDYHGDPLSPAEVLCYYHFGWEFLRQIREAGFSDVYAHNYWSRQWVYLGQGLITIFAQKQENSS